MNLGYKMGFGELMQPGNKKYFNHCMSRGTIGIALSHLSVFQDAYDSGYETVWIIEDDIEVIRNPLILSDLIEELDILAGKEGWDILFTDGDTKARDKRYVMCCSHARKPNFSISDSERYNISPIDIEYTQPDQIRLFTVIDDVVSTLPTALSDNACLCYLQKK